MNTESNIAIPASMLTTLLQRAFEPQGYPEPGPAPQVLEAASPAPWVLGANYQIRTVTMTLTGMLHYVGDKELVLHDAAWIADTGRFAQAVADPKAESYSEVEPFPAGKSVIVGRGSIIDAVQIGFLPRNQK